jgi:acetaldehyde dehydrogenase/alcohol dehydrogenase
VEGTAVCRALLEIEGTGHTAIIHTRDAHLARRFGEAMPASRILVNSPGAHGVIGYTTGLVPSLTLGCGTFGGNSTSDNVSYRHLLNVKRVAEFVPPGFDLDAPASK